MLKTALGNIIVLINGQSNSYEWTELYSTEKNFSVDARYKVIVDVPHVTCGDVIIECRLNNFTGDDVKGCIESGQCLALISFYSDKTKLSIGVEDEIPNVHCAYVDCGLRVTVSKQASLKQIVFGIAWITMQDEEKEDIYTWFAADPTMYDSYDAYRS